LNLPVKAGLSVRGETKNCEKLGSCAEAVFSRVQVRTTNNNFLIRIGFESNNKIRKINDKSYYKRFNRVLIFQDLHVITQKELSNLYLVFFERVGTRKERIKIVLKH
jgi:hypothetical protein